jgi:hypothetical protein
MLTGSLRVCLHRYLTPRLTVVLQNRDPQSSSLRVQNNQPLLEIECMRNYVMQHMPPQTSPGHVLEFWKDTTPQ